MGDRGITDAAAIRMRIQIPATPSEIAASLSMSVNVARSHLYQLRAQGKAQRTDVRLPKTGHTGRGRKWEYLWVAL